MTPEDVDALWRLNLVPGVGPRTLRALLDQFGSARATFAAGVNDLKNVPHVGRALADRIAKAPREIDLDAERALCQQHGVRIVVQDDGTYPARLREIPDPPTLLYTNGGFRPEDERSIAIVGARSCSPYGRRVAIRLATGLARAGWTIVSGLARGIDSAAHEAAIAAGGRTIAVLANGLASVYPPEHVELARKVAEQGAVISESPMLQEPLPGLFPQRNRIISGLCWGVIVVEATPRSGSLSTAKHATEQNREVFAVPGPIDNLGSRGCHALIKDGAKLVESIEDILDELGVAPPLESLIGRDGPDPIETGQGSPTDRQSATSVGDPILAVLDDTPMPIDAIIARTGLDPAQIMGRLSVLELTRRIRRLPGPSYVRYGPSS